MSVRLVASLVWLGALAFSISTYTVFNDHFDRISRARQIVRYGALPFRDFFDPGYFMTEFSSAGLQLLLGDNLLGEMLLNTVFIASGVTVVFLLSRRISNSIFVGAGAALLVLLSMPRAYDFDKVLFYPLGIALCWHYIDRPSARRAVALGAGIAICALFRYDTGVYIGGGAVIAAMVLHWREPRVLARRIGLCAATAALLWLAVLLPIVGIGNAPDAIDQIATYAVREKARTEISRAPRFSQERVFSGAGATSNATAFIYYLLWSLPLVSGIVAVSSWRSTWVTPENVARLATVVSVCLVLNMLVLRDPVGARIGGIAGPPAILAAWLGARTWRASPSSMRVGLISALFGILALAVVSIATLTMWSERFVPEITRPSHVRSVISRVSASPPIPENMSPAFVRVVRYLRDCTSPRDRVLARWFVPELYFFAQRGFAAGMVATFGGHWSESRFETRSVRALASESVPIVIARAGDEKLASDYPALSRYIDEHYGVAGQTDFGVPNSDVYVVLIRNDRASARTHPPSGLPCFA